MKINAMLAIMMVAFLSLQVIAFNTALASKWAPIQNQYSPSSSMQSASYPDVALKWAPDKPSADHDVALTVSFKRYNSDSLQPHIDYRMVIAKNGAELFAVTRHTHTGSDTINQKLDSDGTYTVTVTITGIDFKSVDPKTSTFSLVVLKAQPTRRTSQLNPLTPTKVQIIAMNEGQKVVRVHLEDRNGNDLGMVNMHQNGADTAITVLLRTTALNKQISAWLIASPNENLTKNSWSKIGNIHAIQIGHSEPTARLNLFSQRIGFAPASGDVMVVSIDDCVTGTCIPTMNHITTTMLK